MTTEQSQIQPMRFTVRPPFAVHRERIVTRNDGMRTFRELRVDSYWPGDVVELTTEEAPRHQHAIDGADDAARGWLEARTFRTKTGEPAPAGAYPELQARIGELIAAAVEKALRELSPKAAPK